jgi:hypothetical protein
MLMARKIFVRLNRPEISEQLFQSIVCSLTAQSLIRALDNLAASVVKQVILIDVMLIPRVYLAILILLQQLLDLHPTGC